VAPHTPPPRLAWLARVFALSPSALSIVARAARDETLSRADLKDASGGALTALVENEIVSLVVDHVVLHPRIRRYLTYDDRLDEAMASFVELVPPGGDADAHPAIATALILLARQCAADAQPMRVHLRGPRGIGKRRLALGVATALGTPLLVADMSRAADGAADIRAVLREAWLRDAVLCVRGLDAMERSGRQVDSLRVLEELRSDSGITFIASEDGVQLARVASDFIAIALDVPPAEQRDALWLHALSAYRVESASGVVGIVADRFQLLPAQISAAAREAAGRLHWARALGGPIEPRDAIVAAARSQSGTELATLATRVDAAIEWDRLIVPVETLEQLRELCERVARRKHVIDDWGFGHRIQYGLSPTALFYGASGTGKTMAAAVVARALELDLYRVNLAGVVSKYIGETEKNLDRIFAAAEQANSVLLFDEADALFGKRSEVKDAHDRYANIEISYLLQRMEAYAGIAILSTNQRRHLDEAFTRRLAFLIHFPLPDVPLRRALWRSIWPCDAPLGADVDLDRLASAFPLSGGNIKNVAIAAAFLAASDAESDTIEMRHVLHAIRREYGKMGKDFEMSELERGVDEPKSDR
jgi:hypothetical protein